jgi:hypothetical protein
VAKGDLPHALRYLGSLQLANSVHFNVCLAACGPAEGFGAAARPDEGRLPFCAVIFWTHGASPYERECARLNGRVALVQAERELLAAMEASGVPPDTATFSSLHAQVGAPAGPPRCLSKGRAR